jgi:hypothetical protein
MRTYFTIKNANTHSPLGHGGDLDEARAHEVLVAPRPQGLVKSEWYVTEWYGDGSDDDEIISQCSADEWLSRFAANKRRETIAASNQ